MKNLKYFALALLSLFMFSQIGCDKSNIIEPNFKNQSKIYKKDFYDNTKKTHLKNEQSQSTKLLASESFNPIVQNRLLPSEEGNNNYPGVSNVQNVGVTDSIVQKFMVSDQFLNFNAVKFGTLAFNNTELFLFTATQSLKVLIIPIQDPRNNVEKMMVVYYYPDKGSFNSYILEYFSTNGISMELSKLNNSFTGNLTFYNNEGDPIFEYIVKANNILDEIVHEYDPNQPLEGPIADCIVKFFKDCQEDTVCLLACLVAAKECAIGAVLGCTIKNF